LQVRIQGVTRPFIGSTSQLTRFNQRLRDQPLIPTRVVGADSNASERDDEDEDENGDENHDVGDDEEQTLIHADS